MKLYKLDLTGVSVQEQLEKIEEEEVEFLQAISDMDVDNIIEELWDSLQSKIGLCNMLGIGLGAIARGYDKHVEKLRKRNFKPRD